MCTCSCVSRANCREENRILGEVSHKSYLCLARRRRRFGATLFERPWGDRSFEVSCFVTMTGRVSSCPARSRISRRTIHPFRCCDEIKMQNRRPVVPLTLVRIARQRRPIAITRVIPFNFFQRRAQCKLT